MVTTAAAASPPPGTLAVGGRRQQLPAPPPPSPPLPVSSASSLSIAMAAAASSISTTYHEIPWVEKYRPTKVADVVGNSDAIARLQVIACDDNMSNITLLGPPGIGKTTSIFAPAHDPMRFSALIARRRFSNSTHRTKEGSMS